MKNDDRIVELLSEMPIKHDAFVDGLSEVRKEVGNVKREISGVKKIQLRQENLLLKILEVLAGDVPKFDQVIELEELKGGKIILKRTHA